MEREGSPHSAGRPAVRGAPGRSNSRPADEAPSLSWGAYSQGPHNGQKTSLYRQSPMEGASSGSHLGSDQSASTSHHGYLAYPGSDPMAYYRLQQRASLSLMHQVALDHGPRHVPPSHYSRLGPWIYAGNGGEPWDYNAQHARELAASYYDVPPRYYDSSWSYNDGREFSQWRSSVDHEATASGGVPSSSQIPSGMALDRNLKSPGSVDPGKYDVPAPGAQYQDQRHRQRLPSLGSNGYPITGENTTVMKPTGEQGSESPQSPAPPVPKKSSTRPCPQCSKPSEISGSPMAGPQRCTNHNIVRDDHGKIVLDKYKKPVTKPCTHIFNKPKASGPPASAVPPVAEKEPILKPTGAKTVATRGSGKIISPPPAQKRPSASVPASMLKRPASQLKPFTPPVARPPSAIGLPGASSTEQQAAVAAPAAAAAAAARKAQRAAKARVHVNSVANLQRTKECPVCKMTYGNKMGGKEGGSRCTNMITARDGSGNVIYDQHGSALTQQCPHVFMSTAQTLLMKRKAEAMSSELKEKGLNSKPRKLMNVEAEFWKVVQKLEKDLPKLGGGDVFVALVALVTPCSAEPSKNLRLATRTLSDGSTMRLALLRAFTGKYSEMVFHNSEGDDEAMDKGLGLLLDELVNVKEALLQGEAKRRLETETATINSSDLRSFLASIGLEDTHDSLKAKEFDLDTLVMGSISETDPGVPGMITTEFLIENIGIPRAAAEKITACASKIRRVQLLKE